MTNAKGDRIRKEFMEKRLVRQYERTHPTMNWPLQQSPALQTFHIWSSTIKELFPMDNNYKLRRQLGKWVTKPYKHINSEFWT